MIAQVVHKLLRSASAVTDLVGTAGVHYIERPQTFDLPAVVVQRITSRTLNHLKGASAATVGQVRVIVLADSYLGAADLAAAVRSTLNGHAGNVTVEDSAGNNQTVAVGYLLLGDESDTPSDHRDGAGRIQTHGIELDFDFSHQAPAPGS